MGQSSSRNYTYQQYFNAIQTSGNNNSLNSVDLNSLDPYEVLSVPKNFTWEELKNGYRKAALLTHPDKNGGNDRVFNYVTKCFETLAIEFKKRDADKPHHMLKEQSKNFFLDQQNSIPHPSEVFNRDVPFEERFNKTFDICKVNNEEMDFGYGSIMDKSSKNREELSINNIFNRDNVDNSTFNDIFKKNVAPPSKELIKFKEPEPLQLAKNIQYTELGGKKPDDYSCSVEQAKNGLNYTDYMKAYNGQRLVNEDDIINRKEFKNVEEYENYRDKKIKKKLSSKELQMQQLKKEREEKEENERLNRLKLYDENITRMHDKANRLLIK
jgi:curved DNA-binding protein CbpA